MSEPKTFAIYIATIVIAVSVLGLGGAFVYALLAGLVVVPDTVTSGFWQVVLAFLTLIGVVAIPFVRDVFARQQRQLTQDKLDTVNSKLDTTAAAVSDLHAVVATQFVQSAVPSVAALADNTAAVEQATATIAAVTDTVIPGGAP